MRITGVALIFTMTVGATAARAGGGNCFQLSPTECDRIESVVTHWKAPSFAALPIVGTSDPAPVSSERPDPKLDQANALAAEAEGAVGPCRFNETESRVEVQAAALKLTDVALTQCLAAAFAQARYRGVESEWLRRIGAHEAWVIKGGQALKVAIDAKLDRPGARLFWASFATRELLKAAHGSQSVNVSQADIEDTGGRTIASVPVSDSARSTTTEKDVRELLGI